MRCRWKLSVVVVLKYVSNNNEYYSHIIYILNKSIFARLMLSGRMDCILYHVRLERGGRGFDWTSVSRPVVHATVLDGLRRRRIVFIFIC